jgi:hypothetical protein
MSVVQPTRSQNTAVTVLRISRADASVANGAPHRNAKPGFVGFSRPQLEQVSTLEA